MLIKTTSLISRFRPAIAGLVAALFLSLSLPLAAAENASQRAFPVSFDASLQSGGGSEPIPLVLNATGSGFDFDLGGSDTRKLQLYLDAPLSPAALGLGLESRIISFPGRSGLGLDANVAVPLSPALSVTGAIQQSAQQVRYQPVGSIQCTDGVLSQYSYTASGCRFVDDAMSGLNQGALSLGARYETPSTATAISWFTRNSDFTDTGTRSPNNLQPAAGFGADLLTPVVANPLLPALPSRQPLSYFDGQASGVDLSFELGVATDDHGDLRFGLALTRVLDAEFNGLTSNLTPWGWTVSDAFNTAQMNVEWNRGSFSGGIQGFYRDQVDFLNRDPVDSLTTFDVHFTWRTPWNADLSVGASNILNAGADEQGTPDAKSSDPFESIYGRIPYVRYKQDL
ncbi:MAG: hypothetical protein R3212_01115 [Xanthomonadales bacterium]|nr:hypothetical protein [Xanthomonadales bacterium]